ncbi:hypothetical protein B0H17DRAFT_151708 [Mycena rosella]|uniref:Uncharacterized protein n=1 Tax=Mycena rosella TaxID=1033263 RepID=A0AAD7D1X8_MYCRO|nr:hypothetical protein B0H17DRAFT_151708 [Mycena rosella]
MNILACFKFLGQRAHLPFTNPLEMPRDTDKECPCCGEKVSASTIRRHLRGQTTKSVLVAQEHSYGQQRRRLLRLEAVASDPTEATIDSSMDVIVHDEDVPMDRDLELPDSQHSDTLGEDGGRDGSESESDGDPFEGRPEEIFWEDSDEEDDVALGGDFQAAPWLQGLSAEQRLEEIFNVDAAQRGHELTADEMKAICAHNYKVDTDLGARAYDKLARAFPELADLPSRQQLRTQITFLSGVVPVKYDCCPNSCCCYAEPSYAELDCCPFCGESRRDSAGRSRNTFHYLERGTLCIGEWDSPAWAAGCLYCALLAMYIRHLHVRLPSP